jgi:Asp-tRNA(Asn)/Glu-tRNA(Gln) amidotransferase A subunit family amidase
MTAPKLLTGDASFADVSGRRSARPCFNTAPLNLTGHPALSVPSYRQPPTAIQVVAAQFDERTAVRVAFALER